MIKTEETQWGRKPVARCDEPACEVSLTVTGSIYEAFDIGAKSGWKIVHDGDGPEAATFCPEHAKNNVYTASKTGIDVVREVVEHMTSPEGQAESIEAIRQAIHRGRTREKCKRCPSYYKSRCTVCGAVEPGCNPAHYDDPQVEAIDHPLHYGGDTTYEAIKVIENWGLNFHLGNAVKYICRAGKKGDVLEDLRKSVWYIEREIERRSK